LEHATYGLAFASGSAATVTILHLIKHGDHAISVNDVYGGTNRYFSKVLRPMDIDITFIDMTHVENVEKAIQANTKVS
jgi:cystathionine gamma-lyase